MCGIVGILHRDPGAPIDRDLLERMTDLLAHRGPDERGVLVDGPVGLGHRRLSIIDLASGQQPMVDAQRARAIVFNGEIYNYRDLRGALAPELAARLRTASDTEVLLQLADAARLDWLERLNGMFGFALWESRARRLLLARDRLGVKPLYWVDLGDAFLFASEIKPLLLHPRVARRVNAARIPEYLAWRSLAGEETLFEGIRQVPPGHVMVLDPESRVPRIRRFWNEGAAHDPERLAGRARDPEANAGMAHDPAGGGIGSGIRSGSGIGSGIAAGRVVGSQGGADAQARFLELFEDAVRQRLVSDVPVGTYNSGGLDSSLVTAIVRSMRPGELHTFSVGFEEGSHDERRYADIVARQCGTTHHAIVVGREEYVARLDEALWHLEEPINHPHTVQLMLLSRVAKDFVTVVLTGEGSDEVFGGYPRYNVARIRQWLGAVPDGALRRAAGALAGPLARAGARGSGWARRAARLAEGLSLDAQAMAIANARYVPRPDLDRVWPNGLGSTPRQGTGATPRERAFAEPFRCLPDPIDRLLYHEQRTYLPSLLTRLDKTSMAAGIEARTPFLDYRLVEWSYGLGADAKIRGLVNKWIVKQAARRWLPDEIVFRPKVGFDVPVGQWLRDGRGLGERLDLLRDRAFRERGTFDAPAVAALVDEHRSGAADHAEVLWGLVNLEMWHRMFIDGDACGALRAGRASMPAPAPGCRPLAA